MIEQGTSISRRERIQSARTRAAVVGSCIGEKVDARHAYAYMLAFQPLRTEFSEEELGLARKGSFLSVPMETSFNIYSDIQKALITGEESVVLLDGRTTPIHLVNSAGIKEETNIEWIKKRARTHGSSAEQLFIEDYYHAMSKGIDDVLSMLFEENEYRRFLTRLPTENIINTPSNDISPIYDQNGEVLGFRVETDLQGITVNVIYDPDGMPFRYLSINPAK